jgi:predicted RNA-binding Zn ribbon-like protein
MVTKRPRTMKALLLAGHPGLELLNTTFAVLSDQTTAELIGDGAALLDWLVEIELLTAASAAKLKRRFGRDALDQAAVDARALRRWAADWLARWRENPDGRYDAELQRLNQLLARGSFHREIIAAGGAWQAHEQPRITAPGELIALLAWQVARVFTEESAELVKRCAGPGCVLWFVDRTKAHRRMFCSATACGNRAKVAAFRERQRGSG